MFVNGQPICPIYTAVHSHSILYTTAVLIPKSSLMRQSMLFILLESLMYEGKGNSSSLAYNWCETRDKRLLGRDPDRSWCHLHTCVKFFWSYPMAPWISATAYECASAQSMDPWAATKKKLYTSVEVTSAPVWVPTQWPLVPNFTSVVG